MHGNYGARPWRDGLFERLGVDAKRALIDVDGDRLGAGVSHGICRRDEREIGDDYFISGFDAKTRQGKV
jgi:hypothetical protein